MSAPGTSLSTNSGSLISLKPARLEDCLGLSHAPHSKKPCIVKPLSIKAVDGPDGAVSGLLHLPPTATATPVSITAAVLLSGAGGGVVGPSSIYLSLADKLASLDQPVPALRLDYRYPARDKYCVKDVLAAMKVLEESYARESFVLVGWSFGGAPVFTIGGQDPCVVGCATVASQTAETEGIRTLSPKPLLLLHGTGDRSLSKSCSESLYERYVTKGDPHLQLFANDDYALTRNSLEAEQLNDEKVALMERGGDLRWNERVD